MKRLMITAIAVFMLPLISLAQFSLSGKITDKSSTTLPGATVKLNGKTTTAATDGSYQFTNIKAGNQTLTVSFVGYQTQTKSFNLSADQTVNIELLISTFLADEVIVRATRAGEKSATTYKNIGKAEIEQNNFGQDLPFILNNTPGVVVTSDAGAGVGYTGIRIRGSDASRVNVTINGIPYNDSESQGTFWVNMPDFASSVDNIQIQRGVGTSTNGAGAFGGSLNIQTSAPAENAYAELNNTYGSFNTLKNTVKVGTGLINNKWSFDGRLSRIKSDGFIDRAASDLQSFFLSGAYYGKNDLLRVNVFAGTEKTYQAWNGVPESRLNGNTAEMQAYIDRNYLSETDAQHLLTSNSRTYNSFTYKDQNDNYKQAHYQAIYAKQVNSQISFNAALHYTDGEGYFEEYKAQDRLSKYGLPNVIQGGDTISRSNLVRRRWLDNNFYGATFALNYNPNQVVNFTLGGAYNEYRGKHFGQVTWAEYASTGDNFRHYYDGKGNKDDFNIYGKVNYNPIEKLSLFGDLQYRRVNYDITGTDKNLKTLNFNNEYDFFNIYGKVNYNPVEKLNLFGDLQYRRVNYDITGTDKNLKTLNFNNEYDFFNPKVGATYSLNEQSNIYTSFSVANKEPNRDDFTNIKTGLLPKSEKLNNVELGYRFKNSDFNIGANVYGMFYKDQLIFTGEINEFADAYRQNVDKSYRAGVELDASYIISPKFAINANAAFSKNKIKDYVDYVSEYDDNGDVINLITTNYANPDISFSPASVLFGELVYKPAAGFAVAFQSKYVSKQYMDNTQNSSRQLDAYWVNNARLGYDFAFKGIRNVNVGLLVNNLFDKMYESNGYTYSSAYQGTVTAENFYFPQAGTNFLLSLNIKF